MATRDAGLARDLPPAEEQERTRTRGPQQDQDGTSREPKTWHYLVLVLAFILAFLPIFWKVWWGWPIWPLAIIVGSIVLAIKKTEDGVTFDITHVIYKHWRVKLILYLAWLFTFLTAVDLSRPYRPF